MKTAYIIYISLSLIVIILLLGFVPFILSTMPILSLANYSFMKAGRILQEHKGQPVGFDLGKFIYHSKLSAKIFDKSGNDIDARNSYRQTYWVKGGEIHDSNIPVFSYLFYF